jgi:methanogenic corrinoid protein MtbC1
VSPRLDELRARYLRAQLAGDRREALRIVIDDGLGQGASIVELQAQVIRAAQNEIGQLWQRNLVSIAQEHMATAISQLVLATLFERARILDPVDKKILIACVEGEHHELPARLVADFLELEGFAVRYLGANVPHADLVELVAAERPDAVGLSVTMSFNMPALHEAVARLRESTAVPIFVGGYAVQSSPGIAAELGVVASDDTPAGLLATARRLCGLADPDAA